MLFLQHLKHDKYLLAQCQEKNKDKWARGAIRKLIIFGNGGTA